MTKRHHKVQQAHPLLFDVMRAGTVMDGKMMMGYGLYKDLFGVRSTTEPLTEAEQIKLEALSDELDDAISGIREFKKRVRSYLESEEAQEHKV